MMHKYREEDLATCLKDRRLVFVGDSAIRHTFWATAKKLGFQEQVEDRHANFVFRHRGVTIEFIWDPYLNSSGLQRESMATSLSTEDDRFVDSPAILLIGGGLWHARYLEEQYMPQFGDSVQALLQRANQTHKRLLEKSGSRSDRFAFNSDSLMIFAPILDPVYKLLTPSRAKTITPERIHSMNLYLQHASIEHPLPVAWSYISMTTNQEKAYQSDGLHVIQEVATRMADVLLNVRCNAVLRRAQTKAYPMDKTCCSSYESTNWTQATLLRFSMWLMPFLVIVTGHDSKRLSFLPSWKITRAIMTLGMAICYCYYADRTQLFEKAQKQYETVNFVVLCSVCILLGLLSIRRSSTMMRDTAESKTFRIIDEAFLSRHQTEEWKGWMQCAILIYHYTGASKILWIYEIIRLLVASYLFLSGFGHTIFFYKKADYSLRRCATVLIRLNMLSCILPYVMNTEYIFYYFAPLISFWYMVIYFTMAIGHSRNDSLTFLLGKIAASATLVTALIRIRRVFEILFYLFEKSCNIRWDVKEWRFRLQLDSYIVYVGMLCAILFIRVSEALRSNAPENTSFDRMVRRYFHRARLASGTIGIMIFPTFFILASKAASKPGYNSWVPYISAFPIFAFIVLRNFSHHGRNFHSSVFAWIGRHSLETFTLQFHIWLAADTKGLLALGVVGRATRGAGDGKLFDMAIFTIIFLWVCWHVASATQTLTSWLVDPREGREDIGAVEDDAIPVERLSRTKSLDDMKRNSGIGRFAGELSAGTIRLASRIGSLVAGDLRARLAIVFGVMWLLNIVSARFRTPRSEQTLTIGTDVCMKTMLRA